MKLTKQEPYVTADMIEINGDLRAAIASMVDENVRSLIGADYSDPLTLFDDESPGTFNVHLDTERGIKVCLSLRKIVEMTMLVFPDDSDLLDGLAAELESLAALIREA